MKKADTVSDLLIREECLNIFQRKFAHYRTSGFSLATGNVFSQGKKSFPGTWFSAASTDNTREMAGVNSPACFLSEKDFISDEDAILSNFDSSSKDNNPEKSDESGKEKSICDSSDESLEINYYAMYLSNKNVMSALNPDNPITPPQEDQSFTDTEKFSLGGVAKFRFFTSSFHFWSSQLRRRTDLFDFVSAFSHRACFKLREMTMPYLISRIPG